MSRAVLLVLALSGVLGAADLQLWNTTELTLLEKRGFRWDAFGIIRTREHITDAYDDRLGTFLSYRVNPRFSFGGGYMHRWLDPDGKGTHHENRFYGGPSILLASRPVRIESITLYERHIAIPGRPDFNRYKQAFDIERRRTGVSPFLFEQLTWRRDGFMRTRTFAGLRWRFGPGRKIEVGYQFESLKYGNAWIPRHSIRTTLGLGRIFHRRD